MDSYGLLKPVDGLGKCVDAPKFVKPPFGLLPVLWTPSLGVSSSRRWLMQRRRFGSEFKVEAIRLVRGGV